MPYNRPKNVTFCSISEVKTTMHIPYGLCLYCIIVIFKIAFKPNFRPISIWNLYFICVPVQISTWVIHSRPTAVADNSSTSLRFAQNDVLSAARNDRSITALSSSSGTLVREPCPPARGHQPDRRPAALNRFQSCRLSLSIRCAAVSSQSDDR